jgi:hypothetical protein
MIRLLMILTWNSWQNKNYGCKVYVNICARMRVCTEAHLVTLATISNSLVLFLE